MEWMKCLQRAIDYMEEHLEDCHRLRRDWQAGLLFELSFSACVSYDQWLFCRRIYSQPETDTGRSGVVNREREGYRRGLKVWI